MSDARAAAIPSPFRGPLYVASLWVPVAALGLAAKLYEAGSLGALHGPLSVLAVCARDLVFFGLGFAFWLFALRLARLELRVAATVTFHVLVPLAAVLTVIDLAFFAITGTLGDWYLGSVAIDTTTVREAQLHGFVSLPPRKSA